ncbi:MAG TPA: serine--tRNA ligase [Candidatus Gracilibacteria bacterium]|nr:serine--tRNA ligase [Candidatus Gracilibacteria bacterium]
MLDIKDIIARPDFYRQGIRRKNIDPQALESAIQLYTQKNLIQNQSEQLKAKQNELARNLPKFDGDFQKKTEMINQMSILKKEIQNTEPQLNELENQLQKILGSLPNPAHESVPEGQDDQENQVYKLVNEKPEFNFNPKTHWELGAELDLIDSEGGARVSGSRFFYLKNELVHLQFALIQYALGIASKYGFQAILPPMMVNARTAHGTGYLESGHEDEVYCVNPGLDDLYLIGTSEVPGIAYYTDQLIPEEKLPIRMVAYSSCFRREAGSGGKDNKGIIRGHQFDKIELLSLTTPEESWNEHELILKIEEEIWSGLGLHYRVMNICGGDLGGPAAKKYDIEAWLPGENNYREMTSTSNCTDFQARRLNIRMKNQADGKNRPLHTLNGTGIALGRCLVAIMENYQTAQGEILVPPVLQNQVGFQIISRKS